MLVRQTHSLTDRQRQNDVIWSADLSALLFTSHTQTWVRCKISPTINSFFYCKWKCIYFHFYFISRDMYLSNWSSLDLVSQCNSMDIRVWDLKIWKDHVFVKTPLYQCKIAHFRLYFFFINDHEKTHDKDRLWRMFKWKGYDPVHKKNLCGTS